MSEREALFSLGDQVKITGSSHPWSGAIGRLVKPWDNQGGDWVIRLETENPGHEAAVFELELKRV